MRKLFVIGIILILFAVVVFFVLRKGKQRSATLYDALHEKFKTGISKTDFVGKYGDYGTYLSIKELYVIAQTNKLDVDQFITPKEYEFVLDNIF